MQALSEELIALVETRPMPPENLWEPGFSIEPSGEVADWTKANFILEGSLLSNPKHAHLRPADLHVMWTNIPYLDGDVPVVGMAELVRVGGSPGLRPSASSTSACCTARYRRCACGSTRPS